MRRQPFKCYFTDEDKEKVINTTCESLKIRNFRERTKDVNEKKSIAV